MEIGNKAWGIPHFIMYLRFIKLYFIKKLNSMSIKSINKVVQINNNLPVSRFFIFTKAK